MRELDEAAAPNAIAQSVEVDERKSLARRIRTCLALILFLHITGASVIGQVYPKVVLDFYRGDDAGASTFNGWLTGLVSMLQFVGVPGLSAASDSIGRRTVMALALVMHSSSALLLAVNPSSILLVTVCQVASSASAVLLPVSQAVIADLARITGGGGSELTHGLGAVGAVFGLAIFVGPLLGGALSSFHAQAACLICATLCFLALLCLLWYGWEETARKPGLRRLACGAEAEAGAGAGAGAGARVADQGAGLGAGTDSSNLRGADRAWSRGVARVKWREKNPFSVLRIFGRNRALLLLSLCLLLSAVALNVYMVWYNYLNFRFGWGPLRIGAFFSVFGLCIALVQGLAIRAMVPGLLTENQGVVFGSLLQGVSCILFGLCTQGWMMYPALVCTVVQLVMDPCLLAVMSQLVEDNEQGSLQGAASSLRILAQGIAAPLYGEVFSWAVSPQLRERLGFSIPGAPLFLAGVFSFMATGVALWELYWAAEDGRRRRFLLPAAAELGPQRAEKGGEDHLTSLVQGSDSFLTLGGLTQGSHEDSLGQPLLAWGPSPQPQSPKPS